MTASGWPADVHVTEAEYRALCGAAAKAEVEVEDGTMGKAEYNALERVINRVASAVAVTRQR